MNALRRFLRSRDGATALEFAMVAPIFFALIFSTFEAGWMMVRATALDRALDIAVRKVRVAATDAPTSQATMKSAICANMTLVVPVCASAMLVEMQVIEKAADIPTDAAKCVDRGAGALPSVAFTTGAEQQILFVRACLVADPITPLIGLALQLPKDSKGGYRLIASTAFMNEPSKEASK